MNPLQSVISRIGSDFFALMVPGAYVLACVLATILSAHNSDPLAMVRDLNGRLMSQWPTAVGLLLLSYLVGQVINASPVNRADILCGRAFKWQAKGWHQVLYESAFPYAAMLKLELKEIRQTRLAIPKDVLPNDRDSLHTTFNYWKVAICKDDPSLFILMQAREARVRLYAGMFLSGTLGTVCGIASLAFSLWFAHPQKWIEAVTVQTCLSLLVLAMFGFHLRRIRAQEVDTVFFGYLALLERQAREDLKGKGGTDAPPRDGPPPRADVEVDDPSD